MISRHCWPRNDLAVDIELNSQIACPQCAAQQGFAVCSVTMSRLPVCRSKTDALLALNITGTKITVCVRLA